VRCLVDTGARLTILPAGTLKRLGIKPRGTERFELADGSTIKRQIGNAFVELDGRSAYTRVVFGKKGDSEILGMLTLEELHLWIDPITRSLHPLKLFLKRATHHAV